jgi:hypothetical protein
MQREITQPGPLLDLQGRLTTVGWSRTPLLDCNIERANFYAPPFSILQPLRIKRWDYYAVFTPRSFFSATIADLGYAGNIFVYRLDFSTSELHEEGLVIPLSHGITLPRNSTEGESHFGDHRMRLTFRAMADRRYVSIDCPAFDQGKGIQTEFVLHCKPEHESMNIVIPIGQKRFYYNRKINCLPAEGFIQYGNAREELYPNESLGSLDWGRGVWEYSSFWNWASVSGFLPDGRSVGLNLGCGFGDLSAAAENSLILEGRIHKLDQVKFGYKARDYSKPWTFTDSAGRLEANFVPFKERVARTSLGVINSEVHQMFGRYAGRVVADDGETIELNGLIGFA